MKEREGIYSLFVKACVTHVEKMSNRALTQVGGEEVVHQINRVPARLRGTGVGRASDRRRVAGTAERRGRSPAPEDRNTPMMVTDWLIA